MMSGKTFKMLEDIVITITSIRNVNPNDYDEIWAIVRSFKNKPYYIRQVPELSPSWDLFKKYLSLRDAGRWNHESFEQIYRPSFVAQITSDIKAQSALDELVEKHNSGKKIALVCFCKDVTLCHRSIISDMLTERGISHSLS